MQIRKSVRESRPESRSELPTEPLVPPRMVELPDTGRPARPQQPVVLDDDDLDVPDFLK